jgi:endonuclease/exonuclease/phosphatase family protein
MRDTQASRRRKPLALAVIFAVFAIGMIPGAAEAKKKKHKVHKRSGEVTLMTRNLYLGADLGPALTANIVQFADRNGTILNDVDASNFPARAVSLAAEIKSKNPDIVGLQEAALWRTQVPADEFSGHNTPATQVRYDFIASLLGELNKGADPVGCAKVQRKAEKKGKTPAPCNSGYTVAYTQPEFDFEGPADTDHNPLTGTNLGPGGVIKGADLDGRLTMRDAILVKNDPGIKIHAAFGGTFNSLLRVLVGGVVPIDVTRGYVQADANVRGNRFRIVNAHLEAFDSAPTGNSTNTGGTVNRGEIRQAQAKQLLAGPLHAPRGPSILIGDLNSNVPGVQSGDSLAFQSILNGGFLRLTNTPISCCYDDLFNANSPGLDHQVDQIVTNSPKIAMKSSSITTTFANGLWSSDHAGVASTVAFAKQHKKKHKKHHKKH